MPDIRSKIEKDVPIPQQSKTKKALPTQWNNDDLGFRFRFKHYFADLEVGDSYFLPNSGAHAVYNAVLQWRRRHASPKRFTVRQWFEDGVYGHRVWRIE